MLLGHGQTFPVLLTSVLLMWFAEGLQSLVAWWVMITFQDCTLYTAASPAPGY